MPDPNQQAAANMVGAIRPMFDHGMATLAMTPEQRAALTQLLASARPAYDRGIKMATDFGRHIGTGPSVAPQPNVPMTPFHVMASVGSLPSMMEYARRLQHALLGSRDPHLTRPGHDQPGTISTTRDAAMTQAAP